MHKREGVSLPIYAALSIPTASTYPSLRCLQWSADGQVFFLTKSAAYVLSPDHGIHFDSASVIKATPNRDDPALGWFKTMIQAEKETPFNWTEYSQAWGTVSLGSLDQALTSMAISPTGLSPHGGCIVATLSSNMDVILWTAEKNYLKGEWVKVFEITPYLLDNIVDDLKHTAGAVLKIQVSSIEWTPQVNFDVTPAPLLNGSLLVLGSRAGYITFLRYPSRIENLPEYVGTLAVSEKWIVHLAFDTWNVISPGIYEAYLAHAAADGSIGLIKITQTLRDSPSLAENYTISSTFERQPSIYGHEGNAGVTSLKWIQVPGRNSILVSSTPGQLKFFSAPSPPSSSFWSGYRAIRLRTQKTSRDSSAFHPVTGVSYIRKYDTLIVALYDGSFHAVRDLSTDPKYAESLAVGDAVAGASGGPDITSKALSQVLRTMFELSEKGSVDKNAMLRIAGAVSYDGAATMMWVQESSRPSDFSFISEAKHTNRLMVAQMWDENDDDSLLESLNVLLDNVKTSSGVAPLHLLRPYILHLRDPKRLAKVHARFLEVLRPSFNSDDSTKVSVKTLNHMQRVSMEKLREQFRVGLATNLFGWDQLLSLRMRLSLADFGWKLASNEEMQAECGRVAQSVLNAISHRILRIIIRRLLDVVGSLTANEVPFVSRMVVQSMLAGSPIDLSNEGKHLSELIQPLISTQSDPSSASIGGEDSLVRILTESCPACGGAVDLEDIVAARCANGHTWGRCSVTTFIISTPWVRTCVGCSRKAFLPPSALDMEKGQVLPKIAQGWVVEELLEAVKKCLYCANGFVAIL